MPDAGKLPAKYLQDASQTSCNVLRQPGPEIRLVGGHVTGDEVPRVHAAPSEDLIRERATRVGLPAGRVSKVEWMIGPATAEAATVARCGPRRA